MNGAELIAGGQIMAILRNQPLEQTLKNPQKAWDLGIDLVEVPIQTAEQRPILAAAAAMAREQGRMIGAGTIVTVEQVEYLSTLGVGFCVAPGIDADVVKACQAAGIAHIPGVATPSEIQLAVKLGCTAVKAFPASVLGTGWFKAMKGPFPTMKFVATGGMDAHNALEYLAAGANMIAVGSALDDPVQLDLLGELINK